MFGFLGGHALGQGLTYGASWLGQNLNKPGKGKQASVTPASQPQAPRPQPPGPAGLGKPRNPPPNAPEKKPKFQNMMNERGTLGKLHAQSHAAAMAQKDALMGQHAAQMQQSNDVVGRTMRENAERVNSARAYDAQVQVAQAQAQAQAQAAMHQRETELAKTKYAEDAKAARNQQILAMLQQDQGGYGGPVSPYGMAQPFYGPPHQQWSRSMRVSSRG